MTAPNDPGPPDAPRWRPFAEIEPEAAPESGESEQQPSGRLPFPVDICEDKFEYLILAGIPGVPVEDVEVDVRDDALEIRARKAQRPAEAGRRYLRIERQLGLYLRRFALPQDADTELLRYDQLDGVLRVYIPKTPPLAVSTAARPERRWGEERALPEPHLPGSPRRSQQPEQAPRKRAAGE